MVPGGPEPKQSPPTLDDIQGVVSEGPYPKQSPPRLDNTDRPYPLRHASYDVCIRGGSWRSRSQTISSWTG